MHTCGIFFLLINSVSEVNRFSACTDIFTVAQHAGHLVSFLCHSVFSFLTTDPKRWPQFLVANRAGYGNRTSQNSI